MYHPNSGDLFKLRTSKVRCVFNARAYGKSFNSAKSSLSRFDISDLSSGMYIIKAYNDQESQVQIMKLVK
jgi:hypothetical protein